MHLLKFGGRFALTQIRQSPNRIAYERRICCSTVNEFADFWEHILIEKRVSESTIVPRNVSQAPYCLLFDFNVSRRIHNLNEDRHRLILDQFKHEMAIA